MVPSAKYGAWRILAMPVVGVRSIQQAEVHLRGYTAHRPGVAAQRSQAHVEVRQRDAGLHAQFTVTQVHHAGRTAPVVDINTALAGSVARGTTDTTVLHESAPHVRLRSLHRPRA